MTDKKKKENEDTVKNTSENGVKEENSTSKAKDGDSAENVIENLHEEISMLKDQILRARAETENVRRRGEKDRMDAASYAATGFARDMLTIADNFSRANETLPETIADDLKAYVEGVDLTHRELLKTLERHGITIISPALGDVFDSNLHQAMFEMESEDHPVGSIANVVAPGYQMKDRLLRPAMVGVVKK